MTPYEAGQNLESIRMLMERAGRYSNFSGISCVTAGALAIAAAGVCRWRMISFEQPHPWWKLIGLWAAVLVLAFLQNLVWTWIHARRQKERLWTHLTRSMMLAILPGFFTGAALTGFAVRERRFDMLPGVWMLAYGTSILGAALFAGRNLKIFGALFLVMGAFTLHWREFGVEMMAASFGFLHIGIGMLIAWKYRV